MEKRIELEKRGRAPAQIKELNLDNCKSTTIMGLTNEYTTLGNLSLINVGLTSLRGFPKLPNLEKLELSDNRISSGLNVLVNCPKLTYLSLSGNRIKDLETLAPLKELKCLKNLELFNCDVSTTEGYREKVYELIPNLEYLDGYDKDDIAFGESSIDEDCAEEEDENNFYKDEESEGESEVSEEDEPDVNDDEDEEDDEYLRRDLEDESEKENDYSSENEEGEGDDDDDDLDDDDEEENETLNGFKGTKRKHSDSEDE